MNLITQSINYFKDSFAELKKVNFPSRNEVIQGTLLVIVAIFVATLLIALFDTAIVTLIKLFVIK